MAREVINATNAQFFAKFHKEKWGKKREVNRIAGGVIIFRTAPPTVAKYDGPTDREHVKSLAEEAKRKMPSRTVPTRQNYLLPAKKLAR